MRPIKGQSSSGSFNHSSSVKLHKIPTLLLSKEGVLVIDRITIPGRLIEGKIQLRVSLPNNLDFGAHGNGTKEMSFEFSLPNINTQEDYYTFEGVLATIIVKNNNYNTNIFAHLAGSDFKQKMLKEPWKISYTYTPTVKETGCVIL